MNLQLDSRSERLIDRQIRAGRFHSPEEVVARALEALPDADLGASGESRDAVRDMLEFSARHRFTLGDVALRDLVREGRKR